MRTLLKLILRREVIFALPNAMLAAGVMVLIFN
jgi:hypothetical protein